MSGKTYWGLTMRFILAVAAAAMLSSTAMAADAIVAEEPIAPVVAPVITWTGGYIGVHAGYGWGDTHDKNNPDAAKQDIDGFLGGLQAGYNWQFDNNVVLGAEADISFGDVKEKWYDRDNNQYSPYYGEDKVKVSGSLRARLGYAADRFMPYVTGGLAWASQKHTLGCDAGLVTATNGCQNRAGGQQFETSKSKTSVGWVVGAGAEYALTDNWILRGEYLYTDLGKNKVTLSDPNYPTAIADREFETKFSTVRLGVSYKF